MAVEKIELTDWNEKARAADLAWIDENLQVLNDMATTEYNEKGRGVIFVNTTEKEELSHQHWYLPQAVVEELEDNELKQRVREYDPIQELILVLEKTGGHYSIFQIDPQIKNNQLIDFHDREGGTSLKRG